MVSSGVPFALISASASAHTTCSSCAISAGLDVPNAAKCRWSSSCTTVSTTCFAACSAVAPSGGVAGSRMTIVATFASTVG